VSANAAHIDRKGDRLSNSWQARRLRVLVADAAFGWIAAAAALCFAVNIFFSRYLFWDSYLDLTGGRFVAHHGIPWHEALTTVAKRSWIDQQWLAHWTYYEAWTLGGYPLVAGISSLLIALAFALLCALLVSRKVPPQRAFLWSLIAFVVCVGNTVIRAQSFAYPLFVLLLWLILADARRPGPRFLLVIPLLVLWSNLHGTALLAITLVVGYSGANLFLAARARRRHLVAVYLTGIVGAAGALFANPYGPSIVHYYRALIGNPVIAQYIVEWAPPSLGNIASLGFFALLFAVIAVTAYGIGRGARLTPTLVVIVASLGLLATRGVRYQTWFALAGVVLAGETLAAVRPAPPEISARVRRGGLLSLFAFVVVAIAVLSNTHAATFERLAPHKAMSAAAAYTAIHPGSTILADEQSSSALLWLHPQTAGHVAFDARLEQYGEDDLRSWFSYIGGIEPGWPTLARSYDVLVASRKENPNLVARLEKLSGWRIIAADEEGIALARAKSVEPPPRPTGE
jgi:hypothetical protein